MITPRETQEKFSKHFPPTQFLEKTWKMIISARVENSVSGPKSLESALRVIIGSLGPKNSIRAMPKNESFV